MPPPIHAAPRFACRPTVQCTAEVRGIFPAHKRAAQLSRSQAAMPWWPQPDALAFVNSDRSDQSLEATGNGHGPQSHLLVHAAATLLLTERRLILLPPAGNLQQQQQKRRRRQCCWAFVVAKVDWSKHVSVFQRSTDQPAGVVGIFLRP